MMRVGSRFVAVLAVDASPQLADALDGSYVSIQIVPQESQSPYVLQFGGGFTYEPIDGGPGARNYPADHVLPTDCAAVVRIESSAYPVVEPFRCYESFPVG